jgi:hypothetical protein
VNEEIFYHKAENKDFLPRRAPRNTKGIEMDKFVQKRFAAIPADTEGIGKSVFYHKGH